jgi:plastocyanin
MRLKKLLALLSMFVIFTVFSVQASAYDEHGSMAGMSMGDDDESYGDGTLSITFNGKLLTTPALLGEDFIHSYVPIRAVSEALGAQIKWDQAHQAVLINSTAFLNRSGYDQMEHHGPLIIFNDQMLMPARNPVLYNNVVYVYDDTVAKMFNVTITVNKPLNQVQIVTPENTKQFMDEEAQVSDVFNGVGMIPHIADDGAKEFTITAQLHAWSPLQGVLTTAWTFNGQVPGQTIRVTEGDHVRITLINKLPEPTTIHWHGIHVPNEMDGVPGITQNPVLPGQTFVYDFVVDRPGTYMYHSHYDEMLQIGNGMYGTFIVDPKDPKASIHYDHDYTMMLSGFSINSSAEEDYYTINGRSYPDTLPIEVKKGETVHIRLLNIDSKEVHTMHLHGMDFQVIAKDGSPISQPQTMNTILIGPGETYDIAFTASSVGTWTFHCNILDHTMNGDDMVGGEMGGLVTLVKVSE